MESVLIVSSSENGRRLLMELTEATPNYSPIVTVKNGCEARKVLNEATFEIVIINAPLGDEFGHDLSIEISQACNAGVILIVKDDIAHEINQKVEDFGVFVLSKPLSKSMFTQVLRLIAAFHRRIVGLEKEKCKLETKLEEIRLIDRAKCVLIQYLGMTEPSAHRYIEKQAMDMRITRHEVAEGILKTYEM